MRRRVARTKPCAKTGKITYRDEESAIRAMKNIQKFGEQREAMPIRAYECEFGPHWHLTSRKERA